MKHTLKPFKKRIYLFSGDKKIKMIPVKYQDLCPELIFSFISDVDSVFLNDSERFLLELHIFKEELKTEEPYVYELIGGFNVSECRFVKVKFGSDRYELLFENGVRVKCNSILFNYNLYKTTINSDT